MLICSFFGTQEGDFRLSIVSIAGWTDRQKLDEKVDEKLAAALVAVGERDDDSVYEHAAPSSCCVIL